MLKKIKYWVRTALGSGVIFHLYKDIIWGLDNWKKRISIRRIGGGKTGIVYFVIDPHKCHPGLADRFKGIINIYYLAKINGLQFKIIYKVPFKLEEYLEPNKIDWVADYDDLDFTLFETRFLNECQWHVKKNLSKKRQYHIYNYIGDVLIHHPYTPETKMEWKNCYDELFKPTVKLQSAIDATGFDKGKYVAVHLRFVNALEHFEEGHYNELKETEKQKLINRCRNALMEIYDKYEGKYDVLCFSDSKRFLYSIADLPVKTLDFSSLGHVSFNNSSDAILKSFLDFYMISRSFCVYRIKAPEMFSSSCFSLIAAHVGGVDFIDKSV